MDGEEIATGSDPNYADPKPDASTSEIPLEFGEVEVDHNWKTVTLNRIFDDPVVIAGAMSYEGSDPAVIRVRNVNRNSFEVRIQEWDYLNQNHTTERVGYIVIESGSYELPGGTRVEAGRFEANAVSSFASVQFEKPFGTTPVVLAATTSVRENDAVSMRLRNISTTKFDYRIQEQEVNSKQHISEEAGYIAWEPSAGTLDGFVFEIGRTSNSVTHIFQAMSFYAPFSSPPIFVAGMQTTDGGDTAAVRWQNKQAGGIEVKVEEEQSKDTETNHTTEVMGYMVLGGSPNPAQDGTMPTDNFVKEAEAADLYGDFVIGSDSAASSGEYVHVAGWSRRKSTPDEDQKVEFTFNISETGYYRIKGWVYAPDSARDSFFVKVNDNPTAGYEWHVLRNTEYAQDYVRDGVGSDPVEIWLDKIEPTVKVTVYQREAGTRLDKIELKLIK